MRTLLESKDAVFHGAGGAIGGAVARAIAGEGAKVFLAGRTLAKLGEVAAKIHSAGGVAQTAQVFEGDPMKRVASSDSAAIAFDRLGDGPPVIVVCGAACDRALMCPTAEELAKHFTVFNYDRRGRGDSGDTAPYAVEREIEDIGALIAEAGGTASVYAHSSGAGLALHAAAHGLPISKLVLHEPPYVPEDEAWKRISREYAENLRVILSEGRRGDAVELFFTTVGMPQEMVDGMRQTPRWAELEAMAHTLAYDSEIMGDNSGGTAPTDLVGRVTTETLVLVGGASPAWTIDIGGQVADALPNGRYRVLEGQEHVVPPEVLVPVLAEFFAG